MAKILVLSDSHAGRSFMRLAVQYVRPDAVIHLGDFYEDGEILAQENPHIRVHQVPGNCDRFRCAPDLPQVMCYDICGVRLLMTHGHLHGVKSGGTDRLSSVARSMQAKAALYGHTHVADCRQEADGLWILNPGACGSFGGSVGLIVTEDDRIRDCKILQLPQLEALASGE